MSKLKIVTPANILIEQTAGEFAATFFEAARSSNMSVINLQGKKINLMRYKNNPRLFAKAHLEKFIPAALHALVQLMNKPNFPPSQKEIIYQAIMERTNDEGVNLLGKSAGLPEFENTILYKDDTEKPKPIVINTPKLDFSFNSVREKNG